MSFQLLEQQQSYSQLEQSFNDLLNQQERDFVNSSNQLQELQHQVDFLTKQLSTQQHKASDLEALSLKLNRSVR